MVGVASFAGERAEADQGHRGDRVGRRRGVVHQVLLAGDELLAVVGGREQPAVVDVPEVVEHRVGDAAGLLDPLAVAGRLGQSGERVDQRGVIGCQCRVTSLWLTIGLPRTMPATVGAAGGARSGSRRSRRRCRASRCGREPRPLRSATTASDRSIRSGPCRRARVGGAAIGPRTGAAAPTRPRAGAAVRHGARAAPGSCDPRSCRRR